MARPVSENWISRDHDVIAPCAHFHYFPLVVERGKGSLIYDADGNEYVDFLSAASSMNLGIGCQEIEQAVVEQLGKVAQYTSGYAYTTPMVEYAERLTSVYPGKVKAKVCFGLSGSDANDAAVKFARAYTGRTQIITFLKGYYGATYGAMSLTAVSAKVKAKIGPFLPGIHSFPYSDCRKCPYKYDAHGCGAHCLSPLEEAFVTHIPPDEVAAVIVEPILGDGGLLPANPEFLTRLYGICKKYGILFIAEEVQQGLGRTGKWFSIEHYGLIPGIVLGKSCGGSLALSAFMGRAEIMDALPPPAHVFSASGSPLACVAGSAAFDVMSREGFFQQVNEKGDYIKKRLTEMRKRHQALGDIRGMGLTVGCDVVTSDGEPDVVGAAKISYRCFEKGLIIIYLAGNVLRFQPALNIEKTLIDRGLTILDQVLLEYERGEIDDKILEGCGGWK